MWQRFETKWNDALSDFGLKDHPRWPYWRQSSFAHSIKQFEGWDLDESLRRLRLSRMLDVISANTLAGFGVFMRKGDYYSAVSPQANSFIGGPYGLAASMLAAHVATSLDLIGARGKVAYVFEAGAPGAGEVAKVFNDIIASPGASQLNRVLSIGFESKRKYVGLQGADIPAYELRGQVQKQHGLDPHPTRTYIMTRLGEVPHYWGYVGQAEMRKWSRIIEIRAKLHDRDLEWPPEVGEESGGRPISLDEFRYRWQWVNFFSREGGPRTVIAG
jgi:hypothetical protein